MRDKQHPTTTSTTIDGQPAPRAAGARRRPSPATRAAWGAAIAAGSGVAMILGACPALAAAATPAPSTWSTVATADGWSAAAAKPTATLAKGWAAAAAAKPLSLEEAKTQAAAVKAKVFTPGAANTKATGGLPTGGWTPPKSAPGTKSNAAAGGAKTASPQVATSDAAAAPADSSTTSGSTTTFTPAKGTTSSSPAALAASGGTSSAAPSQSLAVASTSTTPTSTFGGAGASGAGLGLQQFYGLQSFGLSSQLDASVNVGNGNLVLHSKDLAINAPGLSMRIDQFFNLLDVGQTGSGAAGYGGSLSTGQDIGLLVNGSGTGSTVTFFGPSGFTAAFTATSSGTYTAPGGINADLVHNSDGTWALTYHSSGEKLSFTAGGYLVKDTDRNGVGLTLAYDSSNRLSSVTDGAGRVTTLSWNTDNTINVITDPTGRTVTYGYQSGGGGVKTITYADGAKVTIDNSRTGSLDGIQTPDGNWTYFDYTGNSQIAQITRFTTPGATSGAAQVTKFSYPNATTTVETDPNGGQTTYTIDGSGRVTKVVDPLGHSRSVTWTANSDLATAVDAMGAGTQTGNQVTYTYDSANNLTAVALPTGAAAKASYVTGSACGSTTTGSSQGGNTWQAKCSTDAAGNTRSFSYDAAGNVLAVKDTTATGTGNPGTGATPATYTYQAASGGTTSAGTSCGAHPGQVCTSTDGDGHKTSYAYDTSGNVTTITPPSPLGTTTLTYDSLGRVTSVTDGKGVKTSYQYDAYDRRTTTTYNANSTGGGSPKSTTAAYNSDGNLTYLGDDVAGTSTWGYDALGRQTSSKAPNSNQINFGYDAAGNTAWIDDIYGQVTYGYNAANQLTSMTTPTGSGSSASTETTQFTYDNNGNETSRTLPNGIVTTTTRDNSGRATEIKSAVGSTVIDDQKYTWTKPGGSGASADRALVQTKTDVTGNNVPANSTITYAYDGLSRLTSGTEKTSTGGASASWGYAYDKAGNRTSVTSPIGGTATTYTYNSANEITAKNGSTSGWSSDADGNQTSGAWGSASYDVHSALTSLTPSGGAAQGYGYTGFGNASRLTNGSGTEVRGPLGLQATLSSSGAGYSFHYTPDGRLISSELPDGTSRYYLTDLIGSVVAVSNANTFTAKYSYDPYGNTRSTSGGEANSQPFRYTGAYTDAASGGLYKMGARYYDPATVRFTQVDPSDQEANSFAYAGNNPTNFTDSTGLITRRNVYGAIYGAAAGFGIGGLAGAGLGGAAGCAIGAAAGAAADGVGAIAGCGIVGSVGLREGGQTGAGIGLVAGGIYGYRHGADDPIFG
ncbi:MAG: hypothetical protein PGN11_04060 [Quadrisphaera sp.]